MEHDAYYLASLFGNTLGFLGVNSSLRDLARFGIAFTPCCKKIAGRQIIPEAIMQKIHDRKYVAIYDKGWAGEKFTKSFYDDAGKIADRYQWDAVLSDSDMFKSGGGDFTISPGRLSFGPLISTRMACPPDNLDGPFTRDIQRVVSFFIDNGQLFLELPYDSGTMRFRSGH